MENQWKYSATIGTIPQKNQYQPTEHIEHAIAIGFFMLKDSTIFESVLLLIGCGNTNLQFVLKNEQ